MEANNTINNKRIAKNTLILYCRMLLTVGISFYTTRLVMTYLGVSDFGLYSIVGGVTSMMYMITTSISGGIGRFLTFQLGTGDNDTLRKVFSTSVIILLIFSLLVIIAGETIGVWFVNNKLNVDAGRISAANWVYQFTLIAFILEFLSIPYNASIISHERMRAFAFVMILDVLMRFIIAIAIAYAPFDTLVYYAFLMCINQIILRIVYYVYCKRNFYECSFTLSFDKQIFKNILGYSSWAIMTTIICMFASTGVSLLLNIYYGTMVNAAQNISGQINSQVGAFANNFGKALSPQITKSYAANNLDRTLYLVYTGAKFSFLLLFFPILPILFEVDFVLSIWLKVVPPYATFFVVLALINSLFSNLLGTPYILTTATGDIRRNELFVGLGYLIPFPLCYLMFELGCPPYYITFATLAALLLSFYPRLTASRKYTGISFRKYLTNVLTPLFIIILLSISIMLIPHYLMHPSWGRLTLSGILSVLSIAFFAYVFALNRNERIKINAILAKKLKWMGSLNLFKY